ncbi:hypothetical protein [Streptomyces rimosus]|uniref:hypothetical protein n=1 Tax=Streptomyces rimosus TaxID=1927 RepID=UPI0004C1E5E8|nr:hypothetical protein [Streptomyces rimosus]
MSLSDGGGYGGEPGGPDTGGQTRTRLPDGGGDTYGSGRRPRTGFSSRNLITVVGVVVLLIAAIAFANRGGDGQGTSDGTAKDAEAQSTAPTGTKPVEGKNGGIATGFAKTEQGAQSAAANYAVALGSDGMFKADSRHGIVDRVYTAQAAAQLKGRQDKAYSPEFLRKLGLDPSGNAPKGMTFISRAIPVGTKVEQFGNDKAKVAVWYTGLIGMAGPGSTDPVRTDWQTWTFDLTWADGDWKITEDSQKSGPAPVAGDIPAAGAGEISKAVKDYGGFTYAR